LQRALHVRGFVAARRDQDVSALAVHLRRSSFAELYQQTAPRAWQAACRVPRSRTGARPAGNPRVLYLAPAEAGGRRPDRLSILYVSPMPPSPPRFGAQARMNGLMTSLARRHDLTAISLVDQNFDLEDCRRAMQEYCREVVLIPNPKGRNGLAKRTLQLRSLASLHSFEHHCYSLPPLQRVLDGLLRRQRFDVVNLEFPYLAHLRLKQSPPGTSPPPLLVIDTHEIAHDIVRQFARSGGSVGRSIYAELNWRKLRSEELSAFRTA